MSAPRLTEAQIVALVYIASNGASRPGRVPNGGELRSLPPGLAIRRNDGAYAITDAGRAALDGAK